jgi:hypothetical protein
MILRMQSILKTLLAVCLGLGFLALDAHAKPSVAFLGLSPESDPNYSEAITKRVREELAADTALISCSGESIAMLYAKGLLQGAQADPEELPALAKGLGAQFYASGSSSGSACASKRARWWKPWLLKVKWSQGLRLRIMDAANGKVVYQGLAKVEVPEDAFCIPPDAKFGPMAPLQRDAILRNMSLRVALESSRQVAKVVKEKAAFAAGAVAKP